MTIQLNDDGGLVCAFRFQQNASVEPLRWDDLGTVLDRGQSSVWIHLNGLDQRSRHWIERSSEIPRLARETLLATDRRMRLEAIGDGVVGVIGDLHHEFDGVLSSVGMLRFYLDDHHMITIRHEPLASVDSLRRAVATGAIKPAEPIDLLIHLLNELSGTLGLVLANLMERIDDIEDTLLSQKILAEAGELARIRRDLAQLRRHLVPQRQALAGLSNLMPEWFNASHTTRVHQALERLSATGGDLEQLQERAILLQTELSGRLAEMTNHNLYVLSIVTAVFLPLTLISGIFGMNVGGLPWVNDPHGFLWVMLLSAVTAIITVALLYWRRLF